MNIDNMFKTRTMARILAAQGRIKKARDIYGHLLKQNPAQEDLRAELDALDDRKPSTGTNHPSADGNLSLLYQQWIDTAFAYHRPKGHSQ